MNKFKAYVLKDPNSNIPRYVGITSQDIKTRLSQHLQDVKTRPNLNNIKQHGLKNQLKIIKYRLLKKLLILIIQKKQNSLRQIILNSIKNSIN